ncbi:MAG: hypothetical protein GY950_03085 [bacterium]|nr:hypothetical protein [bacterium]
MPTSYSRSNYETKIGKVELLWSALSKEPPEELSKAGISTDLLTQLETALNNSKRINEEQEDLKAQLKTKTSVLNDSMDVMEDAFGTVRKKIKAEVPKSLWKKYGIEDKH